MNYTFYENNTKSDFINTFKIMKYGDRLVFPKNISKAIISTKLYVTKGIREKIKLVNL